MLVLNWDSVSFVVVAAAADCDNVISVLKVVVGNDNQARLVVMNSGHAMFAVSRSLVSAKKNGYDIE